MDMNRYLARFEARSRHEDADLMRSLALDETLQRLREGRLDPQGAVICMRAACREAYQHETGRHA